MTIQPINERDIALFIGKSDLEKRGLTPEELNVNEARQMVFDAFVSAGLDLDKSLEIEAYYSCCGVLVFARQKQWGGIWQFSDFEELLSALYALGEPGVKASVIRCGGSWYIFTACEQAAHILDEYAPRSEQGEIFYEHLREHGATVLNEAFTATLCSYFAPGA